MNRRFRPRELWWQQWPGLVTKTFKSGDVMFDSDNLLFPVKKYYSLLSLSAFDEYALIAHSMLKSYVESSPDHGIEVISESNRLDHSLRIRALYNGRSGLTCKIFKETRNDVCFESIMSQVNERFCLIDTYLTDSSAREKWIDSYCRHIMYYAKKNKNGRYSTAYPLQARKYVANWLNDLGILSDQEYDEYLKLKTPNQADGFGLLINRIMKNK